MLKTYEVQTVSNGRFDLFNITGDVLEVDEFQVRIYRVDIEGKILIAAFNNWNYGLELVANLKKPLE